MDAHEHDLILRPLAMAGGSRHYLLVSVVSNAVIAGPFLTLGDAVIGAREVAARLGVAVWHEQVDDRGRVMGALLPLFSDRGDASKHHGERSAMVGE